MAESKTIRCPACGEESLLKRVPRYEGFKKVGESLKCVDCGHEFADEAEAPPAKKKPAIFTEEDAPKAVRIFQDAEKGRCCRYCRHYVVNPFTQRCSFHRKEVQATDVCAQFERRDEE